MFSLAVVPKPAWDAGTCIATEEPLYMCNMIKETDYEATTDNVNSRMC